MLGILSLAAANSYANDRDRAHFTQGPVRDQPTPFGLERARLQLGNYAGHRFKKAPYSRDTVQPLKYDPPGVIGSGRSNLIIRNARLPPETVTAINNLRGEMFTRDLPLHGENSDGNWRVRPAARSFPKADFHTEYYVPTSFNPATGSGIGDWNRQSVLGAFNPPKELYSTGFVSDTTFSFNRRPSEPVFFPHRD